MHRGEVGLRGADRVEVDVISYVDRMGLDRRVFRVRRRGDLIGEYRSAEEWGKLVELSELEEDGAGA